ncbi:MAG: hypothetical protein KAJ14_15905, partial [Candidatus Omnitrophica bacterium]|nr:hypothetical protein [Candidatus Omnitrophota bacterium]
GPITTQCLLNLLDYLALKPIVPIGKQHPLGTGSFEPLLRTSIFLTSSMILRFSEENSLVEFNPHFNYTFPKNSGLSQFLPSCRLPADKATGHPIPV